MKLATQNNLHLTYCTNIHPGETWAEVKSNLKQYIPQLKSRLSPYKPFGIGLRLADIAAQELLTGHNLTEFKTWLESEDLYVFTLNGFPFGSFHHQVVKDKVYAPDWTKSDRLNYTLRLIEILSVLLPENLDGGISTLPISYKPWWCDTEDKERILHEGSLNLAQAIAKLAEIKQTTGKIIHIDLEPEPDGMLENTQEIIDYFQDWLIPVASKYLQTKQGIDLITAEAWIREHIRVCYDTCHFAVEYEQPQDIIRSFQDANIKIGKIQLSSAIKIQIPTELELRQAILDRLTPFAESTYLHQVIANHGNSNLKHYDDLGDALNHFLTTEATEWRTHFHVPIFLSSYQLFESTQDHIFELLQMLPNDFVGHHLEIETYTWEVLPAEMKLDISTSIEREYQWILSVLKDKGALPTRVASQIISNQNHG
ncbi:MAG: metabolite traffic protein EboE [Cyanobacteria bacterium J06629_2]